ncbi:MAG: YvcK family protein [Candidatus Pacebacteria bacterium]|nr:YvcK family protein [Candidatus Paceibacterota bacterium]
MKNRKKNIVTIGGGTGSFMLLSELKKHDDLNITAIVAMSDSGGSTGILIDQMGVLPAGDVRQCLVALSETEDVLRKLFTYRYDKSFLKGHTFGNIFLSTIESISGSFEKSIEEASKILNIKGKILPITLSKADLVVEFKNGKKIVGEGKIDNLNILNYKKIYLKNNPKLNPKIKKAIKEADQIIVAPGNFYNSIIPNFLVEGFAKEIKKSKANKYFISNLTTKDGHTNNFSVTDFLKDLYKLSGEDDFIDYVIYDKQKKISNDVLRAYAEENSQPICFNDGLDFYKCQFIGKKLISSNKVKKVKGDLIKRSLLRHDSKKLFEIISEIDKREKIYIFDFDHTLFNTRDQKKVMSVLLEGHENMLSEQMWEYYRKGHKELSKFIKSQSKKFLFKDTIKILEKIKEKKILLSYGDIKYQTEKIYATGIPKYFDSVEIETKNKINFLRKFYGKNKDKEIIFVNDNCNKRFTENADVKKEFPDMKVIVVDKYKK